MMGRFACNVKDDRGAWLGRTFACIVTAFLLSVLAPHASALAADEPFTTGTAARSSTLQTVPIETLTAAYDEAKANVAAVQAKIDANQARIDELEQNLIPAQEERTRVAMKQLYTLQRNRMGIIEVLLSSKTIEDFVQQVEYFERVSNVNMEELERLEDLLAELEAVKAEFEAEKVEAEAKLATAQSALKAEQDERAEKQASGHVDDGANWYATKDEFIAEWAPRIDAYLSGSPLEGQGANFANSAWRYCIDPRWSAGISNTESSKARFCIRPHNCWGWGAADSDPYNLASEWSSWETAIDAHARGLSTGYGYTISPEGAKKYCPNTWEHWYDATYSEMERI